MISCKLTKLSENQNALRTSSVEGQCYELPIVGECFHLMGKPLDSTMDVRHVVTSTVTRIEGEEFWTLNSHYKLELINE